MPPNVRRELLKIQREMVRNRPIIRKKLARGKKRASETIISSVARHYKALDKLAKE